MIIIVSILSNINSNKRTKNTTFLKKLENFMWEQKLLLAKKQDLLLDLP